MKLFNAIATAAVIGASFIVTPPAAEAGRNCPAGTRYHKIKAGGLLIKRTVAEGCFTDYEASSLKMNANNAHRARVQRNIQNANRQMWSNINNNRSVNCTTNFAGNYARTNCY